MRRAQAKRPRRSALPSAASDTRGLDRAEQLLELYRRVTNAFAELTDDLQGLFVLADLHQFANIVLAGLKRAQQLREVLARAVEFFDRRLRGGLQLAPAIDEVLLLLRLEAGFTVQRFQLFVRQAESLRAELGDFTIVRDGVEQRGDLIAQFLDALAALLRVLDGIDRLGALVDRTADVGKALLQFAELLGKFRVGGGAGLAVGLSAGRRL